MPLKGSDRLYHSEFRRAMEEDPDAPCVNFIGQRRMTRRDVWEGGRAAAGGLVGLGVQPDDRISLLIGNRPEFMEIYVGASMCGGVLVPINVNLRGDVLHYMLSQTGSTTVVLEQSYLDRVADVAGRLDDLKTVVILDGVPAALPAALRDLRVLSFEELAAAEPLAELPEREPWDLLALQYTSGTTGRSKGVMYSHEHIMRMGEQGAWSMEYDSDDTVYTCLPLFHGNAHFTSLFPALLARAEVAVSKRFSASNFWREIYESGATAVNILGGMTPILWKRERDEYEAKNRLRTALVIPSPTDYFDEFEERFGLKIMEAYGLADCGMTIWTPPGEQRPGSCGLPGPDWECKIFDEYDEEVPPGTVGELVIRPTRSYQMALGYWQMPEATVKAWRNFWFHTGDLLKQDEDGWFYFVDRQKDALRRRGENISAWEVEQVVLTHPEIAEAAVYGIPSDLTEDEVALAVVPEPGAEIDPMELIKFCEPRLAYFAVPRFVRVVSELPKTQTEKVRKVELREAGVENAWDREESGYELSR